MGSILTMRNQCSPSPSTMKSVVKSLNANERDTASSDIHGSTKKQRTCKELNAVRSGKHFHDWLQRNLHFASRSEVGSSGVDFDDVVEYFQRVVHMAGMKKDNYVVLHAWQMCLKAVSLAGSLRDNVEMCEDDTPIELGGVPAYVRAAIVASISLAVDLCGDFESSYTNGTIAWGHLLYLEVTDRTENNSMSHLMNSADVAKVGANSSDLVRMKFVLAYACQWNIRQPNPVDYLSYYYQVYGDGFSGSRSWGSASIAQVMDDVLLHLCFTLPQCVTTVSPLLVAGLAFVLGYYSHQSKVQGKATPFSKSVSHAERYLVLASGAVKEIGALPQDLVSTLDVFTIGEASSVSSECYSILMNSSMLLTQIRQVTKIKDVAKSNHVLKDIEESYFVYKDLEDNSLAASTGCSEECS